MVVLLEQKRVVKTAIPGPRSAELHAQRLQQVPTGFGITLPIFADRADGGIIVDVDGNQIIDLASGIAVLTCGTYGNVIRLLPPLVIGFDLLDDALAVLGEAITAAEAGAGAT